MNKNMDHYTGNNPSQDRNEGGIAIAEIMGGPPGARPVRNGDLPGSWGLHGGLHRSERIALLQTGSGRTVSHRTPRLSHTRKRGM